jgi:F-type H+-transporting ATPase subunit a
VSAVSVLAEVPFPPSVNDFYLPSLAAGYWVTKFTLMVWLAVAVLIVFFLVAYRDPKIVPTRGQWLAESVYGFARDSMAKDLIGHEGVRFAPYLATLFSFILVTNVFGVLPFLQVSPNAHIAFPVVLGLISYVLFMYQGMRRHGVGKFLKKMAVTPGVPWAIYPLLVPIEIVSNLISRPITLAVRLFANMFAGHLILLVFTLGGFALFATGNFFYYAVGGVSLVFAIVMTLFEFGIALLQAYVFVLLTGFYVGDALGEGH